VLTTWPQLATERSLGAIIGPPREEASGGRLIYIDLGSRNLLNDPHMFKKIQEASGGGELGFTASSVGTLCVTRARARDRSTAHRAPPNRPPRRLIGCRAAAAPRPRTDEPRVRPRRPDFAARAFIRTATASE